MSRDSEAYNPGGQLSVAKENSSSNCSGHGVAQTLQQDSAHFDRLRDMPYASFGVRHRESMLSLEAARSRILREIERDPIGIRSPQNLDIQVEGEYLPVWFVEATIQCSWYGEYPETRTITKHKEVERSRTITEIVDGEKRTRTETYLETVPYNETETVWHRINGSHPFPFSLPMPANDGLPLEYLFLMRGFNPAKTRSGFPPPLSQKYRVLPAVITQREAWEKAGCNARIEKQAHEECKGLVELLTSVPVPWKVERADFMLVYLPFATVRYSANGREYHHLLDLTDGSFIGDTVPLDRSAVDTRLLSSEAVDAHARQKEIDRVIAEGREAINQSRREALRPVWRWVWAFALPALLYLTAAWEDTSILWNVFLASLVGVVTGFLLVAIRSFKKANEAEIRIKKCLPRETPWRSFLEKHRQSLIRAERIHHDRVTRVLDLPPGEEFKHVEEMRELRRLESMETEESIKAAECVARAYLEPLT